jgi:hypothetical protein
MIELDRPIALLSRHGQVIRELASDASPDQARWKPDPDSWSILEVMSHLYDEEREDFRVRLKHILDQAEGLPPAIDPGGWVTSQNYVQRDLGEVLDGFAREREASLAWLETLRDADWDAGIDMRFGRMRAGDMLMAWAAHDLLHLRQLIELRYAYLREQAQPYRLDYAGEW